MKLKLVIIFMIIFNVSMLKGQNYSTDVPNLGQNSNQCESLLRNMIDAIFANNIDLVNSIKSSYLIYCPSSSQPQSSNETNNFYNHTNSTQFINILVQQSVIQNIFSQQNPIFYLIYKMINGDGGNSDTNLTIPIDQSMMNHTDSLNQSYHLTQKYDEINKIVSNLTVRFLFLY